MLGVLALLAGVSLADGGAAPTRPEVWIGHYDPQHLATEGLEWSEARAGVAAVEFYINMLAFLAPQGEYPEFVRELRAHGVATAVQCGYFDWESTLTDFSEPNPKGISDKVRMSLTRGVGEETARSEIAKVACLTACGGGPDHVVLDGPIRRLMHPGADTGRMTPSGEPQGLASLEEALDEVVGYMRTWLRALPDVRFVVLSNFPNWGWRGGTAYWGSGPDGMFWGDYEPVVRATIERLQDEGLPLDSVRADNPLEHLRGEVRLEGTPWPTPIVSPQEVDWLSRLLELERTVESYGVPFDLIANSEKGGAESGLAFEQRSLEYLSYYRSAGGSPARYVFEAWYPHPEKVGPETEPGTLTHLALEAIRRLSAFADGEGDPR